MKLTTANCTQRCIGDAVRFNGQLYTVTANYPRHGYLLMRQQRAGPTKQVQSLRLSYAQIPAAFI